MSRIPFILFEDEHLLVVNKPAGLNTHAPAPHAGEGAYDWLRHREPRLAKLGIVHRLDKETSGLLVFAKSPLANHSLTRQFTQRAVRKKYVLVTDRPVRPRRVSAVSTLVRLGDKYVSRSAHTGGNNAETRFDVLSSAGGLTLVKAEPLTGRTHQIRVHAADHGFPILGDTLYGGTPADRLFLHSEELSFEHPATGETMNWRAPADFALPLTSALAAFTLADVGVRNEISGRATSSFLDEPKGRARHSVRADGGRSKDGTFRSLANEPCLDRVSSGFAVTSGLALRSALIHPDETNAYRIVHGSSDGWPGGYVDRFGDFLLSQSTQPLSPGQQAWLANLGRFLPVRGIYHRPLLREVPRTSTTEISPQRIQGEGAPASFAIQENGLQFEIRFGEGYSVGLFLDQRDNRRRLLTGHVAAEFPLSAGRAKPVEVLNAFAYTCGFSVCAAKAGARVTSLDLSRNYLEWGKRNFELNGLRPGEHDFIFGDAFDWFRRLAKQGRVFDVIVLDPPTFSRSKQWGVFQAEKHYGRLVASCLPLLRRNGVLFASTNTARLTPAVFLDTVRSALHSSGRRLLREHYVPQPPDFPISRAEPAYLKTGWLAVE